MQLQFFTVFHFFQFNIQLYSYTVLFWRVSCPLFMVLLIYIFIYILIIKYFQKMEGLKTNCILYNCIESVFILSLPKKGLLWFNINFIFTRLFLTFCQMNVDLLSWRSLLLSWKSLLCTDKVYLLWWKVYFVLKNLTMKNTRGLPCGRGQTAPESYYGLFHMRFCIPVSTCTSEGTLYPILPCGRKLL